MAYVRSLKEIPLTEEPHASVLAALVPDPTESGVGAGTGVDWMEATAAQIAHLRICPACREYVNGIGTTTVGPTALSGITIGGV